MNVPIHPAVGLRGKTVSSSPKGLDLARVGIAMAVAKRKQHDPAGYAAQRWGPNSRVVRILTEKANLPAINTQTNVGAQMVSDEGAGAEFFDLVRAQSIIGRLPLRRVPFYTRTFNMDEGPAVAWRDEGGAYRTSTLKATSVSGLEPLNVGAINVATDEQLDDRSLDAELIVRDQLAKALAVELDTSFINPSNSGSAGVKPASVTNGQAAMDSPLESLFDWGDTFQGDVANSYIVMSPWLAARLNGAARPNIGKNGGTWAGFPVLTSTGCPEGIFVLIDPEQVAIAIGGTDIRLSTETSIDMVDSSSMASAPTVTSATMVSMFQAGAAAICGNVSANWRVTKVEGVQVFDAQAYGLSGGL